MRSKSPLNVMLAMTVAAILAVGAPVVAQDEPGSSPEADANAAAEPAAEIPAGDIAGLLPTELADLTVMSIVRRGEENLTVGLSGDDEPPSDDDIAQMQGVADTLGVPIADMTTIIWAAQDENGERFAIVFGFQAPGVDQQLLFDTVLTLLKEDLNDPIEESTERGGKTVVWLREGAVDDDDFNFFEGAEGSYVWGSGDVALAALGTEDVIEELFAAIQA